MMPIETFIRKKFCNFKNCLYAIIYKIIKYYVKNINLRDVNE